MREWMNLDSFKDSFRNIGVVLSKGLGFGQRGRFDNHETAGVVCKGARADESPFVFEFLQPFEMCGAVLGAFGLSFRPIPPDNDEFHRALQPFISCVTTCKTKISKEEDAAIVHQSVWLVVLKNLW